VELQLISLKSDVHANIVLKVRSCLSGNTTYLNYIGQQAKDVWRSNHESHKQILLGEM
jgi:hypothetical protein